MKPHVLLIVNAAKLVAFTALLSLLLVILADRLGAAEIDVPAIYSTVPYPFTGPNGITYVLNPDGTMSVGPNQCLRPDGNVTIAKPVLDHAEVVMVDPENTKITYPPKLVRIHKVPFNGTRVVIIWDKIWNIGDHFGTDPGRQQTHHFLQVDDNGKEVDPFWDESLPADPEPEPKPTTQSDDSEPLAGRYATFSPANGGTGISGPSIPRAKVSITGPLSGGEPEHLTSVDPDGGPLQSTAPSPRLLFWYFACLLVGFLAGVGAYRIRARK